LKKIQCIAHTSPPPRPPAPAPGPPPRPTPASPMLAQSLEPRLTDFKESPRSPRARASELQARRSPPPESCRRRRLVRLCESTLSGVSASLPHILGAGHPTRHASRPPGHYRPGAPRPHPNGPPQAGRLRWLRNRCCPGPGSRGALAQGGRGTGARARRRSDGVREACGKWPCVRFAPPAAPLRRIRPAPFQTSSPDCGLLPPGA
jgi:hypothetical protein